ncbi:hypothetical protein DEO72_LG9g1097 [Vigna unguiculata]|uniref:Uncharacterized protein n=1 Tax=Vigna unguiculata TaxID=3917 RepID=A0A4D6MXA9_VIGUN|nr:hypothetical protein DEO72_LG9g1097 [Vigna unguiculata]
MSKLSCLFGSSGIYWSSSLLRLFCSFGQSCPSLSSGKSGSFGSSESLGLSESSSARPGCNARPDLRACLDGLFRQSRMARKGCQTSLGRAV